MQKKETAIEVKVGALVLFSIALLVAFVLVLGDFSIGKGFQFYVEFDNAGGLKPGADVAIAGINVGSVEDLRFITNEEKRNDSAVAVRAKLNVEKKYADAIRTNSEFYITTRGVLGEPYIEIVTKGFDAPPIEREAVLKGVNPPRMDLIISKASELLTVLTDLLDNPEIHTKDLIANTAKLMGHLDEFVVDNRENLDATVKNVEGTTREAEQLLSALNHAVEDGRSIKQTLHDAQATAGNARRITSKLDGRVDPLMDDLIVTMKNARNVSESADRLVAQNEPKLNASIDNVHESTERLAAVSQDAGEIMADVKKGEGTLGGLLTDREIYDDLKEMLRIIKQRPWKIVWKE